MDRVFSDGEQRLEAVTVQVEPASAPAAPRATAAASERQPRTLRWMLALIGMPALISMAMSVWLARNWQASQRALSRERDLQLIERVRRLPPPEPAKTTDNSAATGPSAAQTSDSEIRLPASLEPVMVPLPAIPRIDGASANSAGSEAPVNAPTPQAPAGSDPLLVGVVHAGGGKGSAIFRLDQLSLSASPGEMIGNSGWRLHSVEAQGAVIERQGQQRQLSVGGAF